MMKLGMFLLVPAAALAGAGALRAAEIDKTFHESFEVRPGMRLWLEHGDGDVTITPWEQDVLDVRVVYRADIRVLSLGRHRADFDVEFEENDEHIRVVGREIGRHGLTIGFRSSRRYEYTYTIKAPAYLELYMEGDDGDVRVEHWRSDLEMELDDGNIYLEDLEAERISVKFQDGRFEGHGLKGELFLTADDGDVSVRDCEIGWGRFRLDDGDLDLQDCEGDFDITIDDGDVRMRSVRVRELSLRGDDGAVRLDLLRTDDIDFNLETDDGDIELDLQRGMSYTYTIDSDEGRIRVSLPGVGAGDDRHHASGKVGSGAGRIRIRTSDGRVLLGQAEVRE